MINLLPKMPKRPWFSHLPFTRRRPATPSPRLKAEPKQGLLPARPLPTLRFVYRTQVHTLARTDELGTPVYWGNCPGCKVLIVLDPERHEVRTSPTGIWIYPSLVCPAECGWHVHIREGEAFDCGYAPPPTRSR